MSYFFNAVEERKCIFLTCEGVIPDAQTEAVRRALCALLSWKRWQRIVVDFTAMQSSKPEDLFNIGMGLLRDMPRRARVATIVRRDQATCARLLEKAARNGGVFLTFFVDADKAEAWVQNDMPSKGHVRTTCAQSPATNAAGAKRTA